MQIKKTYYFCTDGHRRKCKDEAEAQKLFDKSVLYMPCKVMCVVEKRKSEQISMFEKEV